MLGYCYKGRTIVDSWHPQPHPDGIGADNPIVVRGGITLPTRNFFDSKTLVCKIVASFVSVHGSGFRGCMKLRPACADGQPSPED